MFKFIKNNWVFILGFVLTLFLFLLRFYHLTIIPVFVDEAIYIRWAQVMRNVETLRFLPLSDGKEPLFMWLIIPAFKIVSNPLVAGRLVSIFAGLGTMIGIGILSFLLFKNKTVSIVAALIYAISPFTFFFDRLALADSLLSMFGVWTFIFAFLSVKFQRLDYAMIAGFALGGAWLTKSPALFFALMLPSFWIFAPRKKNIKESIPVFFKSLSLSLVSGLIGYGFYNILRLGPNFHLIASRNLDYVYPLSHIFTRPLDPFSTFASISLVWIAQMGPWLIYVLLFLGVVINFKKGWKEILVLAIWLIVPILIQSEYAKTFTARYILFSIPFLIILAASSFSRSISKFKYIAPAILILFVFQSFIFDKNLLFNPEKANLPRSERSGYLEDWTAGQGIKETADYLIKEQTKNPKERIVIGTEGYFGTLPDGLQMYLANYPQITAIGVGLGFNELPKQLIESKKAGDTTFFLVNKSRFNNTAAKLGLVLIKNYPKAVNPNGRWDSLLFFEVTNEAIKSKEIIKRP